MGAFRNIFGFRTLPVSILAFVIYLAVILSVLITDVLPRPPKNEGGLDLKQAYRDLEQIAALPHPYNSHANDIVRLFLLDRIESITSNTSYARVHDDLTTNVSYANSLFGAYFEGTNILARIDGTDPGTDDGVLFSAHYDSVSSAPGATDNGMGVATLLQLVQYFVDNRPTRTAIFNFNNGEEDGLNGAHAFLPHQWRNLTSTFLNLEGASSGGRPILFRATSEAPALSFKSRYVPHPHANVISADAFARGVIRSGTDYQVYSAQPYDMQGLDFAFYRGRSRYHTKYDAVPYTTGGRKALWAMMESSRGSATALLENPKTQDKGTGPGVYFDLFNAALVVFPLRGMQIFNTVLATVGPLAVILLVVCESLVVASRQAQKEQHEEEQESGQHRPGAFKRTWQAFIQLRWLHKIWEWSKFWVALVVTVGLQALLVFAYYKVNPMIGYSQAPAVIVTAFLLAFLSQTLVLQLMPLTFVYFKSSPKELPERQKNAVLLQTYIFTWALLVVSLAVASRLSIGSLYFVSAWNAVAFVGYAIGAFEGIAGARGTAMTRDERDQVEAAAVPEANEDPSAPRDGPAQEHDEEDEAGEADERTPLIRRPLWKRRAQALAVKLEGSEETGAIGWWIVQMLVVVPVPIILVTHIALMVVPAMSQSIADGGNPSLFYALISLLSILLVLPLAPFAVKIHKALSILALIALVVLLIVTFLLFPFSATAPLKLYFQQRILLHDSAGPNITTTLVGVQQYVDRITGTLPSTFDQSVSCSAVTDARRDGLRECTWNSSSLLPAFDLTAEVSRIQDTSARVRVGGINSRSCRIYIDNQVITNYTILSPLDDFTSPEPQPGFEIPSSGVQAVRLWSRTWDRQFDVDIVWKASDEPSLKARVGCAWSEYQSGSIGVNASTGAIPAYEEALTWFPEWATPTKRDEGLVEVLKAFEI